MNKAKIFACRTMEDEVQAILPENLDFEFLEYALHRTPDKLRSELQERVDGADQYDTLLFGYGLCSNGVAGLRSQKHTLVVPKVHDCISLLLGSKRLYDKEFHDFPATYYLSRGWIKQKAEPLASFKEYCERFGEETARWLIEQEYGNYQRVVFVHTLYDSEEQEYLKYSREVAQFLDVEFEVREGSLRLFEKLVQGDWDNEFVVNPPGQIIIQHAFL
ncbi:MAG: hypothetical protein PWQ96_2501 [Clostridia bacterium]|jgi:hypothetical protein|nr:hypothetical protein [Clostridiales bacterium]MDK2986856.1 hypothetical protein [Clostridia bacterium]